MTAKVQITLDLEDWQNIIHALRFYSEKLMTIIMTTSTASYDNSVSKLRLHNNNDLANNLFKQLELSR